MMDVAHRQQSMGATNDRKGLGDQRAAGLVWAGGPGHQGGRTSRSKKIENDQRSIGDQREDQRDAISDRTSNVQEHRGTDRGSRYRTYTGERAAGESTGGAVVDVQTNWASMPHDNRDDG